MALPLHYDVRRGLKNWQSLGNMVYGDCVVAAYLHLVMVHNVATSSTWKKFLYRLGFTPPSNKFAVQQYTDFLATLNEKPSGTMGVDPLTFFTWLKSTGQINDFQQIPIGFSPFALDNVHEAMIQWNGCMLVLNLTNRAYDTGLEHIPWTIEPGDTPNPMLGHAIALVAYNPEMNGIVTWGMMKEMSNDFFTTCVYGCWVFN